MVGWGLVEKWYEKGVRELWGGEEVEMRKEKGELGSVKEGEKDV